MSKMKWWLMFRIYVIYFAGNNSRSIRARSRHHPYRIHCCCCYFLFFIYLFIYYIFFSTLLLISNLNDDVNRNDYPSHAMTVAGTCVSFVWAVSFTLTRVRVSVWLPAIIWLSAMRAPCSSLNKTHVYCDRQIDRRPSQRQQQQSQPERSRWNARCWHPRRSRWPECCMCMLSSRVSVALARLLCRMCHLTIYYYYFYFLFHLHCWLTLSSNVEAPTK